MAKTFDKIILCFLCMFLLIYVPSFIIPVLVVLFTCIYASFSLFAIKKRSYAIAMGLFLIASFFMKEMVLFVPLLVYDMIWYSLWWGIGIVALGAIPLYHLYHNGVITEWQILLYIMAMGMAILLSLRSKAQQKLQEELIHTKDSSTELKMVMQKRQRELIERQDYEVHLATLQERNRIAREIHDNVGHMLTRSILQLGALLTIHKEEPLSAQLGQVSETLNNAMNSIRESVHDLHNESMDLRQKVLEATEELRKHCEVSIEYDMGEQLPQKIKYCFIAMVKEATANIIKHSNATTVVLIMREHPGFYQIAIEDNGTDIKIETQTGIGLSNMEDRIEALNGTIHFSTEQGFRILASVPKEKEERVADESSNCR